MNIPWKTLIAYSVHRQKVLILLMNFEREQSPFSSQRVNNQTGHFSPHPGSFLSHTTITSLTKREMRSSTVLHVYKNLSESKAESILLKQQLQHKCSNSCHTANNVPQQKYEDDCFTFRVSLWYQPGSNKKMWHFQPRWELDPPAWLFSFIPWCLSKWVNFITSHCVRSF